MRDLSILKMFWKVEDFFYNRGYKKIGGFLEKIEDKYYFISWHIQH